jgi:hypothetical protein
VIERSGKALVLNPSLAVNMNEFLVEADEARADFSTNPRLAIALAHTAMARYRGDLLPDDPYADWASRPRERARQVMISLLDLCADDAVERGDLDELRRVMEQSIEVSPYGDTRYLHLATVLAQQGRRGEAMSLPTALVLRWPNSALRRRPRCWISSGQSELGRFGAARDWRYLPGRCGGESRRFRTRPAPSRLIETLRRRTS